MMNVCGWFTDVEWEDDLLSTERESDITDRSSSNLCLHISIRDATIPTCKLKLFKTLSSRESSVREVMNDNYPETPELRTSGRVLLLAKSLVGSVLKPWFTPELNAGVRSFMLSSSRFVSKADCGESVPNGSLTADWKSFDCGLVMLLRFGFEFVRCGILSWLRLLSSDESLASVSGVGDGTTLGSKWQEPWIVLIFEVPFLLSLSYSHAHFFDGFEMIIMCDPDSDFSEFSKSLFSVSILQKPDIFSCLKTFAC